MRRELVSETLLELAPEADHLTCTHSINSVLVQPAEPDRT
jgi:hypothetical protein